MIRGPGGILHDQSLIFKRSAQLLIRSEGTIAAAELIAIQLPGQIEFHVIRRNGSGSVFDELDIPGFSICSGKLIDASRLGIAC